MQFRKQERTQYSDIPMKWDVPFNTWLGVKFGEGFDYTFGNVISKNVEEYIWDNGDLLKPEVANRVFGIKGELQFDEPISIQKARLFRERKDAELRIRSYNEMANHSWLSAKGVTGFAAGVLGSIAHPFDLGVGFLVGPVGSSERAAVLAKAGAGEMRQAFARGLIQREALGRYPALKEALIEGTFGNALFEVPVYLQARKEQQNYTLIDSIINVGAGGLFAGGLHLAVRGLDRLRPTSDVKTQLKQAAAAVEAMTPETRAAMAKVAINQELSGIDADVSKVVALDENVIQAKAESATAVERVTDAELSPSRYYEAQEANNIETIPLSVERVALEHKQAIEQAFERGESVNAEAVRQYGMAVPDDYVEVGGLLVREGVEPNGAVERNREEIAKASMQDYTASLEKAIDTNKPEALEAQRQAEITRIDQEHAAKIPAEKAEKLTKPDTVDPTDIEAARADADETLKNITDTLSEEEMEIFQKELEELQSQTKADIDKAVDAGIECIIKGALNG